MVGPTASGKSAVAMAIARRHDGEILSVDSMQVYRGMDIGTAKPSPQERGEVVHHMLDLVEPEAEYSVADFQAAARKVVDAAERPVILVGGSGLHLRAVIDPLEFQPTDESLRRQLEEIPPPDLVAELLGHDPAATTLVDLSNPRRVVRAVEILRLTGRTPTARREGDSERMVSRYQSFYPVTIVNVDPGPALSERVAQRVERMWEQGLVDEVLGLRGRLGRTASGAVGYREVLSHLEGIRHGEATRAKIVANTMALARRQRTYLRPDPRIVSIPWNPDPERLADAIVEEWAP